MTQIECQQPVNDRTGEHSGSATHRVINYWGKSAQKKMGKHLLLCDAHTRLYRNLHPFEAAAIERIISKAEGQ